MCNGIMYPLFYRSQNALSMYFRFILPLMLFHSVLQLFFRSPSFVIEFLVKPLYQYVLFYHG